MESADAEMMSGSFQSPPPPHSGSLGEQFLADQEPPAGAAPPERMLIKDGDMTFSTPFSSPFSSVLSELKELLLADPLSYLESENAHTSDHYAPYGRRRSEPPVPLRRAHLSVRVPSTSFASLFDGLASLPSSSPGLLLSRSSASSRDVTAEYVDASSRTAVLAATEAALRKLMARAASTQEVLGVQRELTRTVNEREASERTKQYLSSSASMSTLRVSLEELPPLFADEPALETHWSLSASLSRALASLSSASALAADAAVFSVVWSPPVLIACLLLSYLYKKLRAASEYRDIV
jgi:hypothetical protein